MRLTVASIAPVVLCCVLLAGCSGGSAPQVAATPQPILDASYQAFHTRAQAAYDRFHVLASAEADDMLSVNDKAIVEDGRRLSSFATAEIAWLASHPATTCYASALASWKSAMAVVKRAGADAIAERIASLTNDVLSATTKLSSTLDTVNGLANGACLH